MLTRETADVLIIGAGPAGLSAAVHALEGRKLRVLILESMEKPGRKLLLSGSGQCNFTHNLPVRDFFDHYNDSRFLRTALGRYSPDAFRAFLSNAGVPSSDRGDGKIFPDSNRARDVLNAFLETIRSRGGRLLTGERVLSMTAGEHFLVETPHLSVRASAVIVSAGGQSYPVTGSNGDGFHLARSLGHKIVPPVPCLAPLKVSPHPLAPASGFAFRDVVLHVERGTQRIASGRGDVLVTHTGISGPGILDISRHCRKGDGVRVELCGSRDEVTAVLRRNRADNGASGPDALFAGLGVSKLLGRIFLDMAQIPDRRLAELGNASLEKLASLLSGYEFAPVSHTGWDTAMATAGGVSLDEIDPQTMQSRIVPRLFFAGEVMDIDGDTGGFNIQAAWSTGALAGTSAAESRIQLH